MKVINQSLILLDVVGSKTIRMELHYFHEGRSITIKNITVHGKRGERVQTIGWSLIEPMIQQTLALDEVRNLIFDGDEYDLSVVLPESHLVKTATMLLPDIWTSRGDDLTIDFILKYTMDYNAYVLGYEEEEEEDHTWYNHDGWNI